MARGVPDSEISLEESGRSGMEIRSVTAMPNGLLAVLDFAPSFTRFASFESSRARAPGGPKEGLFAEP